MKPSAFASLVILMLTFVLVHGQAQTRGVDVEVQGFGKMTIPDIPVRDQEERKLRFYSDLIQDKVIVLSFFYTNCTYACTLQGRTFSRLQSLLGERLGK